jgi:type II secretory pathway pseudopilin PulG
MPLKLSRKKGATLLELIIAVVMLSVGLIVVTLVFPKASASISNNRRRVIASNFAAARMQELKSLPYALVPLTPTASFTTSVAAFPASGCDCSKENLSAAAFQEHTSSFTESSVTYTRSVCINLVARNGTGWISYCPNGLIGQINGGADQGLKSIRILVNWSSNRGKPVEMESMVMR